MNISHIMMSTMKVTLMAVALLLIIQLNIVASFSSSLGPLPSERRTLSKLDLTLPPRAATHHNNESHHADAAADNQHRQAMKHFWQYLEHKEQRLSSKLGATRNRVHVYQSSLQAVRASKRQFLKKPSTDLCFEESKTRSMVKSLVWRLIAGSVTFYTTLRFSGSVAEAWQVVSADFLSKSFTMFLGERLMNKSQAGRGNGSDNLQRSLAKALIWRAFAIANTLTMAVFVTHDMAVASKIASVDAIFKTALMFQYERLAARVPWGKIYALPQGQPIEVAVTQEKAVKTKKSSSLRTFVQDKVNNVQGRLPRLLPQQQRGTSFAAYGANATALDLSGGIAI